MRSRVATAFVTFLVILVGFSSARQTNINAKSLQSATISASDRLIDWVGRVSADSSSGAVQLDWPGIQARFSVFGASEIGVYGIGSGNYAGNTTWNVLVDGKLTGTFQTPKVGSQEQYFLITQVDPSIPHNIEINKRTEAQFGLVTFTKFGISGPQPKFIPPQVDSTSSPSFKFEFIGDSITCGYGNEGTTPSCPFTAATENNMDTYASIVARTFNADYHIEAWSGRGVVRNYGDKNITSQGTMPELMLRTLATQDGSDSNMWNWSSWIPDVVFINLGTNDYSTQPNPPAKLFEDGYVTMIDFIASKYQSNPDLTFVTMCGPMIHVPCPYVQSVVEALKPSLRIFYVDMQTILTYPDDFGCSSHPNVMGHQKMATALLNALPKIIKTKI